MYRSWDVKGEQADKGGKSFHLLQVIVLRGEPLKTLWRGQGFGFVIGELGQDYDSVKGGPRRPMLAGPGEDDSVMYVLYHPQTAHMSGNLWHCMCNGDECPMKA